MYETLSELQAAELQVAAHAALAPSIVSKEAESCTIIPTARCPMCGIDFKMSQAFLDALGRGESVKCMNCEQAVGSTRWQLGKGIREASAKPKPCEHRQVTVTDDGGRCRDCGEDLIYNDKASNWIKDRRREAKGEEVGGCHYNQGISTSPWDLQATMQSSGSVFVDARRADVIKYVWRKKGDTAKMIEDFQKARHCLEAAIKNLQSIPAPHESTADK